MFFAKQKSHPTRVCRRSVLPAQPAFITVQPQQCRQRDLPCQARRIKSVNRSNPLHGGHIHGHAFQTVFTAQTQCAAHGQAALSSRLFPIPQAQCRHPGKFHGRRAIQDGHFPLFPPIVAPGRSNAEPGSGLFQRRSSLLRPLSFKEKRQCGIGLPAAAAAGLKTYIHHFRHLLDASR